MLTSGPSMGFMFADTISVFLVFTHWQLVFVNLVVAGIETFVLRFFFRRDLHVLFGWMALANYTSTIFGSAVLLLLAEVMETPLSPILFHMQACAWVVFVAALLVSFGFELPFVYLAAGNDVEYRRKAIKACGVSQLASYVVLLPFYWLFVVAAGTSDFQVKPTNLQDFVKQKDAEVLYLSNDSSQLMRIRLDGSPAQKVMDVQGAQGKDLTIWKAEEAPRWDLWLTPEWNRNSDMGNDQSTLICKAITSDFPDPDYTLVDWRPKNERQWRVYLPGSHRYSGQGILVREGDEGRLYFIRVRKLIANVGSVCPNALPGDQVVFEMFCDVGESDVAVMDLKTRRIAVVAHGKSPIVISDGKVERAEARP